jgi:hypothetical protein
VASLVYYLNHLTDITASQPKPFLNGWIADILLSGVTTIDNAAARNWHLDVTSTNPVGVTTRT